MFLQKTTKIVAKLLFVNVCLAPLPINYVLAATPLIKQTAPKELQQFIQSIVPNHPRYIAAQAERDAVFSSYNASEYAIYNPEVELDSEKTSIQTTTIGLSQTIDWGDKRGANRLIAKNRLVAAEAKFQQQRQALLHDLLFVARDFHNKKRLGDLSAQRLSLMKKFVTLAKQKHAAGDVNQVEFNLAQLAYSEAVLNNALISSETIQAEQNYLALYFSQQKQYNDVLGNLSVNFEKASLPKDFDVFVLKLPQMRIVRANVGASKSVIALREGESSADPTIAIRGGKENKESLVGVTLSIPLNIRNNYSDEINVARKEYLQAEQLAQQAYRNLIRDIRTQTKHYQLMRSAWIQWQKSGQKSINRQLNLLERLWRSGDLSATDYLIQVKQNLDTRSAGIELETKLWSSWLSWLDSTAQIESWLQLNTTKESIK